MIRWSRYATCVSMVCAFWPVLACAEGAAIFYGQKRPWIRAYLSGEEQFLLSSNESACANCHGVWGLGGQEAGILSPPIGLEALSLPSEVTGREEFSEETFCEALRTGLLPGGASLSRAMPRYSLRTGQCREVWDYLGKLDSRPIVGVTPESIPIVIVAGRKLLDIAGLLAAEFEKQPRVFGRKLHGTVATSPSKAVAAVYIYIDARMSPVLPAGGRLSLIYTSANLNQPSDWNLEPIVFTLPKAQRSTSSQQWIQQFSEHLHQLFRNAGSHLTPAKIHSVAVADARHSRYPDLQLRVSRR